MKPSISTTSVLPIVPRLALWSRRQHIDALPNEVIGRAFASLSVDDLRSAAQVCVRWRRLAAGYIRRDHSLPWNVLKDLFSLLDSPALQNASRVSVSWNAAALSFFSKRLGKRHVHELPAEVVKHAFAFLDFDNLRYAAQVCVRWRDLGIEHPGFWQNIVVTSASAGSLSMLEARLGQSGRRPFTLTVDIPSMHPLIETRLMNLLRAIMPSVQNLCIRLDSFYLISLWRVLDHPAPQLVKFELKLYSPDDILSRIPLAPWIFDEKSGSLKEVVLHNVIPVNDSIPYPAFSKLRNLCINLPPGSIWEFPSYLFDFCPHLEEFALYCGTLTFNKGVSEETRQGLARLKLLDIHLDPPARAQFVQSMPLKDTNIVLFTTPHDFDATYDFLADVRSPFNLAIISLTPRHLGIIVQDINSAYQRTFVEPVDLYVSDPEGNELANVLFENNEFPAQVVMFKISILLWDRLAPYLAYYTTIAKLVIDFDSMPAYTEFVVALPRKLLHFPCLTTLVLESRKGVHATVAAEDVVHFVDTVIAAPLCRQLELYRVLLGGSRVAVAQRFDTVTFSSEGSAGLLVK